MNGYDAAHQGELLAGIRQLVRIDGELIKVDVKKALHDCYLVLKRVLDYFGLHFDSFHGLSGRELGMYIIDCMI